MAHSIFDSTPDELVLEELGQRVAGQRLARNLTQERLAHEAGVSRRTVARLEAGESVQLQKWLRVLRALGLLASLGEAIPTVQAGPVELLRDRGRPPRRRASPERAPPAEGFRWGDEDEEEPR